MYVLVLSNYDHALGLLAILSMLYSSALPLTIFEDAWEGSKQALNADQAQNWGILAKSWPF